MADDQDLKDLVDAPKETLSAEFKSDLDLESDLDRANTARHIAALANYGGGFIAFGFGNDMKPVTQAGDIDKRFHPDRISSIVHKYLEPAVLCDAVIVQSAAGQRHPVVRVPAHGATPVCAKADGPQDAKGRVQGIMAGRYYIRSIGNSGPESAVLTRPEHWHPLIRRLVTADRAALAAMIERALDPKPSAPASTALDGWHQAAGAAYVARVREKKLPWSVPLDQNYYQLSYEFVLGESERIAGSEMLDILQRANSEMRDLVWTGWSMFYPFTRAEIAPYFVSDCYPGQGSTEALEADLLGETLLTATLPDFWRVSSDGKATIVRAYREDRSDYPQPAGKTASLFMTARDVAELVRHARAMTPYFSTIQKVHFRCEWRGLRGRQLRDLESDPSIERISKTDRVQADIEAKPEDLTNAWPEIVSAATDRFARAFDPGLHPGPGWVSHVAPRFRSL